MFLHLILPPLASEHSTFLNKMLLNANRDGTELERETPSKFPSRTWDPSEKRRVPEDVRLKISIVFMNRINNKRLILLEKLLIIRFNPGQSLIKNNTRSKYEFGASLVHFFPVKHKFA